MLYKDYTRELIGFEDVTITFAERKDNQFHIHMKMKRKAHKCPRCGRTTEKIHDYREQRIIDEFRGNADGEKFQCILTDPENRKVLDILPNRKSEDLCRYFSQFKDGITSKWIQSSKVL